MKFSVAIVISVVVHLLIGLGLWLYMEYAPAPDVLVTLDLSSVEISFAETEDVTAAVLPHPPSVELPPPVPEAPAKPEPVSETLPDMMPPIPDAVDIPMPEEKPEVKTPDIPKPEKKPEPEKKLEPKPDRKQVSQASAPTPNVAPKQAKIDAPPRPKRSISPDYPKGARQRGEQGDVMLEVLVNSHGKVDKAQIISSCGFQELDESAVRAVRTARFVPAKSGGKSVPSTARITLTFKLK